MSSVVGSRLLRTFAVALGLGALAPCAGACAAPGEDEAGARGDAVADVGATDVKRQSVGNCWLYGANAWLEALHFKATGETLDLSEGYLTYWYWFGQLAEASAAGTPIAKLKERAYWEVGSDLVGRYGLMREAEFLPDGNFGWLGLTPTRGAMKDVNEALGKPTSRLRLAMQAKDRAAIRAAYDDLWKLPGAIRADLDATFGADRTKTFLTPGFVPPATTRVIAPSSLAVRTWDAASNKTVLKTAADVVAGGTAAWTSQVVTIDMAKERAPRREHERRLQRALHAGLAVPIVWMVDMNARDDSGAFRMSTLRENGPGPASKQGAHLSLVIDYEVAGVPGFGTLPAGVVETRPAALEAALSEQAEIRFFRIKNSWGTFPGNPLELVYRYRDDLPFGTNDLEPGYVFRPDDKGDTLYSSFVLPPGL